LGVTAPPSSRPSILRFPSILRPSRGTAQAVAAGQAPANPAQSGDASQPLHRSRPEPRAVAQQFVWVWVCCAEFGCTAASILASWFQRAVLTRKSTLFSLLKGTEPALTILIPPVLGWRARCACHSEICCSRCLMRSGAGGLSHALHRIWRRSRVVWRRGRDFAPSAPWIPPPRLA
jgi:hypothetical protein